MVVIDNDFQGYYGGTVVEHLTNGMCMVLGATDDSSVAVLRTLNRQERFLEDDGENIRPVFPKGFIEVNGTVLYLSVKQNRSYKKSLHRSNLIAAFPQQREYEALSKRPPNIRELDDSQLFLHNYTDVADIDSKLEKVSAVALHPNYAVVKKGDNEYPVVYHRTNKVAQWKDGEFIPLEGVPSIFVEKLNMELGLL